MECVLKLSDGVGVLKAAVQSYSNIPPNKQKLTLQTRTNNDTTNAVFRDKDTLAACGITDHSTVILRIKERGGKKK